MVERFLRSIAIPCPMQVSGAPVVTVGGVICCQVPLVRAGLALEGRARTVAAPRADAITSAFCRRFSMRSPSARANSAGLPYKNRRCEAPTLCTFQIIVLHGVGSAV